MFECLLCALLGHRFTLKVYTGEKISVVDEQINTSYSRSHEVLLHKWEQLKFCSRCGVSNPYYLPENGNTAGDCPCSDAG